MLAGVSWTWWVGFHAVVAALLLLDALVLGRHQGTRRTPWEAWLWTAFLLAAAAAFAAWIAVAKGHQPALEFVAGYTIESSLSVDNLFVFLVIFQSLRVEPRRQHTALLWGVAGAVILRGLFIATGITLLERFNWIAWLFGLILLYAAWRLLRPDRSRNRSPHSPMSGWIRRWKPARTSLLLVILAVELTDLLFAVDSIPAVLAVSHNFFIVYTSNIAAILGLRSLYFALSSLLNRFRALHYGLGALLAFVALKMIAARWIELSITLSLAVMAVILAASAACAWLLDKQAEESS